jgi:hypothetical protein
VEAIRTNYLQFDSASSLLGFALASCPPPFPALWPCLLRKLENRAGVVDPGLLVAGALCEVKLVKGLGVPREVSPRSHPAQALCPFPLHWGLLRHVPKCCSSGTGSLGLGE